MPFSKHAAGCAPLKPCQVCRAAAFLKEKLKPADFAELVRIFDGHRAVPPIATPATLEVRFDDLKLSPRLTDPLKNDGILTIGDLRGRHEGELLRAPNFGKKLLGDLKKLLAGYGLEINKGLLAAD